LITGQKHLMVSHPLVLPLPKSKLVSLTVGTEVEALLGD